METHKPPTRFQCKQRGFTLVEVTLCIAIIASAVLALVALIPLGTKAAIDSTDATITGLILEDAHLQLEGIELTAQVLTPRFYDSQGIFLGAVTPDPDTGLLNLAVDPRYRAEIDIVVPSASSPHITNALCQAIIKIYWPIDPSTGDAFTSSPQRTVSYPVTTMSAPNWSEVDTNFTPKIEF